MHKFEIYKDKKGESRFRFRAGNGEIMFSSEGYKSKSSAVKAIESIKKNAPEAAVDDMSAAAPKAKAPPKAKAAAKPKSAAKPKVKATAKPKAASKAKAAAAPA
ncbi:YegP family protein [Aliihoeflea sp. PC F10.4]